MTLSILARQRTRLERIKPALLPGAGLLLLLGIGVWINVSRWRTLSAVGEAGGSIHFLRPSWVRAIVGYVPLVPQRHVLDAG